MFKCSHVAMCAFVKQIVEVNLNFPFIQEVNGGSRFHNLPIMAISYRLVLCVVTCLLCLKKKENNFNERTSLKRQHEMVLIKRKTVLSRKCSMLINNK